MGLLNKCSNLGLGKHAEFTTEHQPDTFVKTGKGNFSLEHLANRLAGYCKIPLPFDVKGPPSVPDSPSVTTPDARGILKRQRQRLASSMLSDVPEEAGDFTDDEMVEERPKKKRVMKRLNF